MICGVKYLVSERLVQTPSGPPQPKALIGKQALKSSLSLSLVCVKHKKIWEEALCLEAVVPLSG